MNRQGLDRQELERLLHQTLHAMGADKSDADQFVTWIGQIDDETNARHAAELAEARRTWFLRALGAAMIGFCSGAAAGALTMLIMRS